MLKLLTVQEHPEILCIQETHFKETSQPHTIKGYNVAFKNQQNQVIASGGVAIYVRSDSTIFQEIPLRTELEATAVTVDFGYALSVCSVYLPDSQALNIADLEDLVAQIPTPRIIVGDFNAHYVLWGCKTTDARGRTVEDFMESSDLILLNDGKSTRFNAYTGTFSAMDMSFCDPGTAPYMTWSPLEDLFDSDHYPIRIEHGLYLRQNTTEMRPKWRIDTADLRDEPHFPGGIMTVGKQLKKVSMPLMY